MSRSPHRFSRLSVLLCVAFGLGVVTPLLLGAGGKVTDPNGVAPDRYVYYPGTGLIIACRVMESQL